MGNSVFFKSSVGKKVFMALTGLFLCTFLVGHLLGNLQLILHTGEEGRRAFNEYAYFMGHNIFIKILSYLTYISVIIHVFDGILLTIQNRKARPIRYSYNKPSANSSAASRSMAILGTLILVFLATHMANFWWKMKIKEDVPLHTITKMVDYPVGQNPVTGEFITKPIEISYYLQTNGAYQQCKAKDNDSGQEQKLIKVKNKVELYDMQSDLKIGEAYKDLHSLVINFFSQKENSSALYAVLFYVLSMVVLAYHLLHGFQSAFQSLGINHPKYTPMIKMIGTGFAILVPLLFAIIPIIIYTK